MEVFRQNYLMSRKPINKKFKFIFMFCAHCGGGKRRHREVYSSKGRFFQCSRTHQLFVPFTREEQMRHDMIKVLMKVYLPKLKEDLLFGSQLIKMLDTEGSYIVNDHRRFKI